MAARLLRAGCALLGLLGVSITDVRAAGGPFAVDDADVGDVGTCKIESWVQFANNGDFIGVSAPGCAFNFGRPVELSAAALRFRASGEWGSTFGLKAKTNLV